MPHAADELTEEMDKAFAAFNFLAINYDLMEEEQEEEQLIEIFRKKLIDVIEKTFEDVEYPGDDNLAAYKDNWESIYFAKAVKGKHWKELSKDVLLKYEDSLNQLTPEAIRFYMPAFLIAELSPGGLGYNPFVFWFQLTPPDPAKVKHMEVFLSKLSAFTPDEKAVLRAYVKLEIEANYLFDEEEMIKFWNL